MSVRFGLQDYCRQQNYGRRSRQDNLEDGAAPLGRHGVGQFPASHRRARRLASEPHSRVSGPVAKHFRFFSRVEIAHRGPSGGVAEAPTIVPSRDRYLIDGS
jgi:hypothetical protein